MQVLHLSHIDLDGYGAQYITSHFFCNITFYNANHGKEISVKIDNMLEEIKNNKVHSEFMILITDLGLSLNEAESLQKKVFDLTSILNKHIALYLLDHHISGEAASQNMSWYHLDTSKCATKITFLHCLKHYKPIKNIDNLNKLVEVINSIDIWDERGFGFDIGKVALRMIATSNELPKSMFERDAREFKFSLLDSLSDYIPAINAPTKYAAIAFDSSLHGIKKQILNKGGEDAIMDDIVSSKLTSLLTEKSKECEVYYQDKCGFASYALGGISVLANRFLQANPRFDFFIDVSHKGHVSLRANGQCDVSVISAECFSGGGHKNAAGGRISNFKESFNYKDIRAQVQEALNGQG